MNINGRSIRHGKTQTKTQLGRKASAQEAARRVDDNEQQTVISSLKRPQLILIALVLLVAAAVGIPSLVRQNSLPGSVSVVFLGYTNVDEYGSATDYTSAVLRIENHSRAPLAYRQGPLDIQQEGLWTQDTNWVRQSYGTIIGPGDSVTVRSRRPSRGTKWRSNFFVMPMPIHSRSYINTTSRLNRSLSHLPGGNRWLPWYRDSKEHVISSSVLDL